MAVATRISSSLSATITADALLSALKTAFSNAGLPSPTDLISGTDKGVAYTIISDSTKTRGSFVLRVFVSAGLAIRYRLFSSYDTSANTGLNASTEFTLPALSNASAITFNAINLDPELKGVVVSQGSNNYFVGYLIPQYKPSWWDLNTYNYAFIPTQTNYSQFSSTALVPYSSTGYTSTLGNSLMTAANTLTNRRDILPGVILYTQTSTGIAGRTSDDLIMVAASGLAAFDSIQVPGDTKAYLLLNNVAGGLAVRIS